MQKSGQKKGFSFEPDVLGNTPSGYSIIERNSYVALGALGHPTIYYVSSVNKYFAAPDKELSQERLNAILPDLRWKFSKVEKGKDMFPPSPENIAAKRKELMDQMIAQGEIPNFSDIESLTTPTELLPPARVRAKLDDVSPEDRLIARLNRVGK